MTISTHINRLKKAIPVALALAAIVVPVAQAGEIAVDDHWRDVPSAVDVTVLPQDFRGDDHYRDGVTTILPQNFRGDDWYRDSDSVVAEVGLDGWYSSAVEQSQPETVLPQDFRGDDHYRDSTILPQNFRGDDHYRDSQVASAPDRSNVLLRNDIAHFGNDSGLPEQTEQTVLPQNFRGDDYYRDVPAVSPVTGTGLDWADFGIGAGSMLGALAVLTGLSGILLVTRRGRRTLGRV